MAKPPKSNSQATKQPLVCFSFSAYAKSVVNHLRSSAHDIPVERGLTDSELAAVESSFGFTFPQDLRAILREGLPVGAAFPNWRSSSHQQLRLLLRLPSLSLRRRVSDGGLWCQSWGPRPSPRGHHPDDADVAGVSRLLEKAPVLVPIYRNCYVPARPCEAGNPVLYIDGECVKVVSCDITQFFNQEFGFAQAPVWAPKVPRRIEFWSEVAAARGESCGWWNGEEELGWCLEAVFWRLREGGWVEEEIREMMMMDGCDEKMMIESGPPSGTGGGEDGTGIGWRVRVMFMILLRGGWTREDIVDSLGLDDHMCEYLDSNQITAS